ncbi:hypothetical protein PBRA_007296 [Plasmodiophora brassicae]|uniref:FYVE-type domain-containing protein n=1 Tax=Plasmodiophora brassicae TaxID=37360 RepID=A0A0G4IW45_PLABS|nr:hypothetical protein PBRA_007296 [Plasmodiophora brassicae]
MALGGGTRATGGQAGRRETRQASVPGSGSSSRRPSLPLAVVVVTSGANFPITMKSSATDATRALPAAAATGVSPREARRWVHDHSYDACFGCLRKFNMFNRRHHCRLCGQLFCKSCSSNRCELSPDQGFVRVCDSCFVKQRRGSQPATVGFNGAAAAAVVPLPTSIFSGLAEPAGHAVMVAEFDDVAPVTAACRLTRTLACTCYESIGQQQQQAQAVQSGHWTFDDTRRLRLDLQFQAQGSALFTARLHTSSGTFVGAGHVVIQAVDLRDVRTERVIRMAGSLAWKLSRAASTTTTVTGSGASRVHLLTVVDGEILDALSGIADAQEDEATRRQTVKSGSATSTAEAEASRRRRSTLFEPVDDIVSARTQLQVKADQLRLMKECIIRANECVQDGAVPDAAPLSCMCFHCFGTIVV